MMLPDLVGQTVGKYRLLGEIGRGGMAVVYRALDTSLDRPVAIKVLAPHLAWNAEFVQRFLHEARAIARLDHPHIVKVYEVGELGNQPFLAMQYIQGRPLSELIQEGEPWEPQQAVGLLGQVASALDYAHGEGVIHRDVKPGNILVDERGWATLTDFGLARALDTSGLTQTGTIMGSPAYMSPEQVQGSRLTGATDIYSLAVIAYELLGGRVPFKGDSAPVILHAHVYTPPPPLHQINPAVPVSVAQAVGRGLAKDPARRYPTAGEMVKAVQSAGKGGAARRLPPWVWGLAAALLVLLTVLVTLSVSQGGRQTATGPAETPAIGAAVVRGATASPTPRDDASPQAAALRVEPQTATATPRLEPTATAPTPSPTALSPTVAAAVPPPAPAEAAATGPRIANFYACLEPCQADGSNAAHTFPAGIGKIYLRWDYEGIPSGAHYVRSWTVNGQPWVTYDCRWDGPLAGGVRGVTWWADDGLPSGAWEMTIHVDDAPLLRESFTLEGQHPLFPLLNPVRNSCTDDAPPTAIPPTVAPVARARATNTPTAPPPPPPPPVSATATPLPTPPPPSVATPSPTSAQAVGCAISLGPSFTLFWVRRPASQDAGCPSGPERGQNTSYEPFERGFMIWRGDTRQIYALYNDGGWDAFNDTWVEGDPEYPCADAATPARTPPTPRRGFGKVWCTQRGVRDRLGRSLADEQGNYRPLQELQRGFMILLPERHKAYVLIRGGPWLED